MNTTKHKGKVERMKPEFFRVFKIKEFDSEVSNLENKLEEIEGSVESDGAVGRASSVFKRSNNWMGG